MNYTNLKDKAEIQIKGAKEVFTSFCSLSISYSNVLIRIRTQYQWKYSHRPSRRRIHFLLHDNNRHDNLQNLL